MVKEIGKELAGATPLAQPLMAAEVNGSVGLVIIGSRVTSIAGLTGTTGIRVL